MKLRFNGIRYVQDLTEGSIAKSLLLFFLPIAAGALFQELYNAVDAIIVGRYLGTDAIAAVGGSAHHIISLFTTAFIGFSTGFSVVCGQYFGAKDDEKLARAVSTAVIFSLVFGVFISIIIIIISPALLRLMNTPEEIMDYSVTYLRIYFSAISAVLVMNTEAGILRAVGNSSDPLIYMVISCVINIVLDIVFVVFFGWGIAGAAYATIIAQIANMIMTTVHLVNETASFRLDFHNLVVDKRLLGKMLRIGVPSGLQHSFYDVTNMIIISSINTLGTFAVAAWTISPKVDACYVASTSSAGAAITGFVAQNYGSKKYDRIRDCVACSYKLFMSMTLVFTLLLGITGKFFISMYTTDADLVNASYTAMMIFVNFYFVWISIDILSGTLSGVGDVTIPVIITVLGTGVIRIFWTFFVFPLFPKLSTICYCFPISWVITSLALIIYTVKKKWMPDKKAFLKKTD